MPKTKETSIKNMRKINLKYDEFSKMTNEERNKRIESVKQEAITTKLEMETALDVEERKKLQNKLLSLQNESDLLNGFSNNKNKIDKARSYAAKIKDDLKPLQEAKNKIEEEIRTLNSKIEAIDKELNVEDPSVITNDRYNALLNSKSQYSKEKEGKKAELSKIQNSITNKQALISKCNMVYSSLMHNESWDKINLKAVRMSYQAKNNKKETAKEEPKPEKQEEDRGVWSSEEAKQAYMAEQEKLKAKEKKKENQLIIRNAFKENHPRLAKMMDFFSRTGNKIKNVFKKKDKTDEIDEKVDEKTVEKLKDIDFSGKRDAFVEMFRKTPEVTMSDKGKESLKEIRKTSNELAGKGHKDDEER